MIKKTDSLLILSCDICGETLQDPDECSLLETAASKGWIGYHPEDPHDNIKFNGRNSIHLCGMDCEKELLNQKIMENAQNKNIVKYYHPFANLEGAYQESIGFDCVPEKITVEFKGDKSITISVGEDGMSIEKAKQLILEALKWRCITRVKCDSGVIAEPEGCWLMACANSRISKTSLILQNGIGIIDPDYRGTIRFNYWNLAQDKNIDWLPILWKSCGQLIPIPRLSVELQRVSSPDELSKTERGSGGFGSSVKQQ